MPASPSPLTGIFAAAVTPLTPDLQPDLSAWPRLLQFLAQQGCHGALVLGTTGEGPAFSVAERLAVARAAQAAAPPGFQVLVGTGCANVSDTIALTQAVLALGVTGVVVLPAFYFKNLSPSGVTAYFEAVLQAVLPTAGKVLVYHIPQVTGVGIPPETLHALRARWPAQWWGIKDSQDVWEHTQMLLTTVPEVGVFTGSDALLSATLQGGGAGAITALANVIAPLNRLVWDAHQRGETHLVAQARLTRARQLVKGLANPPLLKALLARLYDFPLWPVRPPLEALPEAKIAELAEEIKTLLVIED